MSQVYFGRQGGEFLVNTQTQGDQVDPTITGLANGGFVVSWSDYSGTLGDSSGTSVKAKMYDARGGLVEDEFLVNTQTAADQGHPAITGLRNGGFAVTWSDWSGTLGDSSGTSIKAKVFDAVGGLVQDEFLVNTHTFNSQIDPAITGLTNGGFVVTWEDYGSSTGLKAKIYNASGGLVQDEFAVNTQAFGNQFYPKITGLTGGGFVVTWTDDGGTLGDNSRTSVKAKVFNAAGGLVQDEFLVNTQTQERQSNPTITGLTNGGFVVTWEDDSGTLGDNSLTSVKAKVFDAAGGLVQDEFLVNTKVAGSQQRPMVTGLTNGDFVVTWFDAFDIKAKIFDAAGALVQDEFTVNPQSPGWVNPTITGLREGGFVVSWQAVSAWGDGNGDGVKAQIYSLDHAGSLSLSGLDGSGNAHEGTPIVASVTDPDGNPAGATFTFASGATVLQAGSSNSYTPHQSGWTITVRADYIDGQGHRDMALASAGTVQVDHAGSLSLSGLDGYGNAHEGTPIVASVTDPDGSPTSATFTFASGATVLQAGSSNSYTPVRAQSGQRITVTADYIDGQGHGDMARASTGTVHGRGLDHDVDGDGNSDILWFADDGRVHLWEMNGAHIRFDAPVAQVGSNWHVAAVADVTGDGKADILWRSDDGHIRSWQMSGTSIAADKEVASGISANWHLQGAADFDGDGQSDLLWRADDGRMRLWEMKNGQISADLGLGAVPTNWHIAGTGDFDGDGKTDLLWRADDGRVRLWEMDGAHIKADLALSSAIVPTNWHVASVADYGGDGHADILWRADDGRVRVWDMNGPTVQADRGLAVVGGDWHVEDSANFYGAADAGLLWRGSNGDVRVWDTNSGGIQADEHVTTIGTDWHIVNHHFDLI